MSASTDATPGVLARSLIGLIRLYQLVVSPLFGPVCRFHPSCSRYTLECVRWHGALRGSYLGMRRILRCHPWNPGGHDPPPLPPGRTAPEGSVASKRLANGANGVGDT